MLAIIASVPTIGQNFENAFAAPLNAAASGVFENADGYTVVGGVTDTVGGSHSDIFIKRFDLEGNMHWIKSYGSFEHEIQARTDCAAQFSDGTIIMANESWDEGSSFVFLTWINLEGDTVKTKRIDNPAVEHQGNDDMVISDLLVDSQDNIILVFGVWQSNTEEDYVIYKMDKQGELIWDFWQESEMELERAVNAKLDAEDNIHIIGAGLTEDYVRFRQSVSSTGYELHFELVEFSLFFSPREILVAQDGIFWGGPGTENLDLFSRPCLLYETESTEGWYALVDATANIFQDVTEMIWTCDSSILVAAQHHPIDSLEPDKYLGWLIKFSQTGEILWERKYQFLDVPAYEHIIHDLKETSDGGIIFCGEARDDYWPGWEEDSIVQKAWVVKLDACGCLVPGCDPNCVAEDCPPLVPVPRPDYFLFGPNPISQFLNIHLGDLVDPELDEVDLHLYNTLGQLVDTALLPTSNTTYIWDLSHLASGQYTLSLLGNGRILQSEKVVKSD